jgi:hypothetical protein
MSRISIIRLLSGALAALALPAASASAGNPVHTLKVHTPAPSKLNNSTIAEYRNGGQYAPRKLPGRAGFNHITLNRGVAPDRGLQQWKKGISGK